jgi:predicted AlkP superfamily phosphohydrolase/phosphomutase/tetratricopeptide (TPR) repeat protein
MSKKNKVLLLGWDAADWKIINRLVDCGQMPAIKRIIENGVMGNISTLEPAYSPMLWTTIATGMYPDKHGILGFSEPTPDHSSIRPVSNSSRKVKALWNILTQNGYKTHVVNWWPSFPAEPVNGIYVSNMFPKVKSFKIDDRQLPDDTVHPPELQNLFAHFIVHPLELTVQHLQPFMPDADFNTIKVEKKLEVLTKQIAEAASVHAAATLALEQEEWDFAAIYWDTIDHFCHGFMNFSPPQMKGIKDEEFKLYKHVVDGAYRLMDMMLARILQLAGDDCAVFLTSDHGFKSGDLRQRQTPNEPAGPAYHHRNVGVFCAKGPGIKKDEIVYGASLLDITPTILTFLGLPVGEDMDGKPLIEIFNQKPTIKTVPSWENIPGECGMLPDEKRDLDPEHSANAIRQLIDLGYIEDPGDDIKISVERTVDELNYNLAQVYYGTQRFLLAKPLLEKLFEKKPYQGRFAFRLADCYADEGNYEMVEKVLDILKNKAEKKILNKEQIKQINDRKVPEILKGRERERWIKDNKQNPIKENYQAKNDLYQLKVYEGDLLLKRGFTKKALSKYKEITTKKVKSISYYAQMGKAYLKTRQWKDAEKMYSELLKLDPDHYMAHMGVGIAKFNLSDHEMALDHLLDSVTLNFYNYVAHYNIGRTLIAMTDWENAANALEISLKINPNFGAARNALIDLYENRLNTPEKALRLRGKDLSESITDSFSVEEDELLIVPVSEENDYEPIIVVSGLPRSGTSLMMQMLHAARIDIYSDDVRKPDENNPKGYFEHEKVKQLIKNQQWLGEATGKAVKIVVPLLYKLPKLFRYKVIFMLRDINEVVESQHRMLVRDGKIKEEHFAMGLNDTYQKYLDRLKPWCNKNKNVEILMVDYKETINHPTETINKIADFLGRSMDREAMKNSISPDLYRTKFC